MLLLYWSSANSIIHYMYGKSFTLKIRHILACITQWRRPKRLIKSFLHVALPFILLFYTYIAKFILWLWIRRDPRGLAYFVGWFWNFIFYSMFYRYRNHKQSFEKEKYSTATRSNQQICAGSEKKQHRVRNF